MQKILRYIRKSPSRILLGLDYDGTLVDICNRPEDAKLSRERRTVLRSLLTDERFLTVFISGRRIDELLRMLRLPPCWAVGDHGAVIRQPDGAEHLLASGTKLHVLDRLRTMLKEVCSLDGGLWVETKAASVAMHYRGVPPDPARAAIARAREIYQKNFRKTLVIMPMKKVVEFIVAGVTKGRALQRVHRMTGGKMPVVYFGDDTTDFSAIEYAERHGRAVFVGRENKTAASCLLPNPKSVHQLLGNLIK
jgi:trehalose 6-phosphate phosphatase